MPNRKYIETIRADMANRERIPSLLDSVQRVRQFDNDPALQELEADLQKAKDEPPNLSWPGSSAKSL